MENSKKHILIVDDDDRIRNLLKDFLSEKSKFFLQNKIPNSQEEIIPWFSLPLALQI